MNTLEQKNRSFTMIEIVVVLIILGVLAAIALPSLFAQIERHRAQEAINTLNFVRSAIETCGITNSNDFTNCQDWAKIDMTDPSYNIPANSNMGSNFVYWLGANVGAHNVFGPGTYSIQAIRDHGGDAANIITIDRNLNGTVVCGGENAYIGFC